MMIQDYAKKKMNNPPFRRRIFITIFIIFFATIVPLILFYFKYQKAFHNRRLVPPAIKMNVSEHTRKNADDQPTTQFDFYTLLPKIEVPVTKSYDTQATSRHKQ